MKSFKLKNRSQRIFILNHSDEMRHPYETALAQSGAKLEWFSSFPALLATESESEPAVVIVDLDCLEAPVEPLLEQLRARFDHSDLIALSSTDSAHLALQCVRSGYSDFLVKPASPEELAWSVRKVRQRSDFLQRLNDPKAKLVHAVTQISACTTPTLVQLTTLEFLRTYLGGEGAVWIKSVKNGNAGRKVICAVPRGLTSIQIGTRLRNVRLDRKPRVVRTRKGRYRTAVLPCISAPGESVVLWGIKNSLARRDFHEAMMLLEHSGLCLLNIQKLEEIKQQTFLDDLTGLYNSRYLRFAINNAILKCRKQGQAFSVLFIDVDHFKTINDQHGHLVGSEFLVAIGKTIRNAVRNIDPVFRYGGDEFVVILQSTHQEGASEIGERIRKNIERRIYVIKNRRIRTTVSIGIAVFPDHASERETLLRLADEAMYSAKKENRNAVHLAYGLEHPTKQRRAG